MPNVTKHVDHQILFPESDNEYPHLKWERTEIEEQQIYAGHFNGL
jgi:hypothetical protein